MNTDLLITITIPAILLGFILGHRLAMWNYHKRQDDLRTGFTRLQRQFTKLSTDLQAKDDTRAGIDIGIEYVLNSLDTYIEQLRQKLS